MAFEATESEDEECGKDVRDGDALGQGVSVVERPFQHWQTNYSDGDIFQIHYENTMNSFVDVLEYFETRIARRNLPELTGKAKHIL